MINNNVISAIDEEIERLTQARKLLSGPEPSVSTSRSYNRKPKPVAVQRKKRHLTRAQRDHLSKMQKERWAKAKAAKKPSK